MARVVRDKSIKPKVSRPKAKRPPKPTIIDEDLADVIVSLQRIRDEKPIPLEKVLEKHGYKLER